MVLHGLLGDRERVRDLLVRHALRDVVQDLHLARRQRREHARRAGAVHRELAELGEHLRGDGGLREDLLVDDELAGANLADGIDELLGVAILVQVRGGTRTDRVEQALLFLKCGEDHDGDVRKLAADALRRLDARELGQVDLDDQHVGLELDGLGHGFLAIGHDGEDLHVRFLFEDLHDANGRDTAGVGEHDADRLLRLIGQARPLPSCPSEAGV